MALQIYGQSADARDGQVLAKTVTSQCAEAQPRL